MNFFETKLEIDNFSKNEVEWATFFHLTNAVHIYCRHVDKTQNPWFRDRTYVALIPCGVLPDSLTVTWQNNKTIFIRGTYKKERDFSLMVL